MGVSTQFILSACKAVEGGRSFFQPPQKEGWCFDRLSTNGRKGGADL